MGSVHRLSPSTAWAGSHELYRHCPRRSSCSKSIEFLLRFEMAGTHGLLEPFDGFVPRPTVNSGNSHEIHSVRVALLCSPLEEWHGRR